LKIAKRQFERAAAKLPDDVKLSVHWHTFELNPNMPPEGLDRVAYRSRKFGSRTAPRRVVHRGARRCTVMIDLRGFRRSGTSSAARYEICAKRRRAVQRQPSIAFDFGAILV
jgi:predicted DsbA family dithiol-disulfide isomerase